MKNTSLDVFYLLWHQLEKYNKLFDPKKFNKEWRLVEPITVDDQGQLTGTVYTRSTLGPMCSDRVLCWKFIVDKISENPQKYSMTIYTLDKD